MVVVGAIAVTAIAHRRGMQPSLVVVVLAAAVSFIPGLPRLELDPELILSVVLPPLLYSAALNFSFASLTRNIRPIVALGVGMVVVSTLVTGVVAWWVVPGRGRPPGTGTARLRGSRGLRVAEPSRRESVQGTQYRNLSRSLSPTR
jgi:monovalent cation/hydrogen antiporter